AAWTRSRADSKSRTRCWCNRRSNRGAASATPASTAAPAVISRTAGCPWPTCTRTRRRPASRRRPAAARRPARTWSTSTFHADRRRVADVSRKQRRMASAMNSTESGITATAPSAENTRFIVLISCVATIGGFLFGFDSGVINGTVDGLQLAFDSDSVGTSFNVASMLLGCAVGAFFAGRLADHFGRRAVLLVAAVFFLVSAWGSGIATGSLEFVLYRVLGGFAVGAASVMSPAYISEVSSARYRGRLATVQQIASISGLFAAFLSNYLLARHAGASINPMWLGFEAWRWMFWIEILPAAVFLLALLFIPESPRYLVAKRRGEHGLAV